MIPLLLAVLISSAPCLEAVSSIPWGFWKAHQSRFNTSSQPRRSPLITTDLSQG
jgi:hypothetical protein